MAEDAVIFLPEDVQMSFQNDPVFSEGASFVSAQDIHRTKVLDGRQGFDDAFLLREGNSPFGKTRGHNHREHFRREAHRHRDGKEEGRKPIVLDEAVEEEDDRGHDEHETD